MTARNCPLHSNQRGVNNATSLRFLPSPFKLSGSVSGSSSWWPQAPTARRFKHTPTHNLCRNRKSTIKKVLLSLQDLACFAKFCIQADQTTTAVLICTFTSSIIQQKVFDCYLNLTHLQHQIYHKKVLVAALRVIISHLIGSGERRLQYAVHRNITSALQDSKVGELIWYFNVKPWFLKGNPAPLPLRD